MSDRNVDRTADADDYDPDEYDDYDPNPTEQGKWISALIALLGAWMIVEGVLFDVVATQFWNDILVGLAVTVLGIYNTISLAGSPSNSLGTH